MKTTMGPSVEVRHDASAESVRKTETIPEWKQEEVDAIVEMSSPRERRRR